MEGMDVVMAIEAVGSENGLPSEVALIENSGELPLH